MAQQSKNSGLLQTILSSVDVINMGLITPVLYGNAYSFNGVQINGDGKGKDGTVGIYYEAPSNSQPLITGLALFMYDSASGKPSAPSPINAFTLNRFQSRYISQPASIIWVLVGSDISNGSVIPTGVFKSATSYSTYSNTSPRARSTFQLSRYLEVTFNAQSQASIHFDTSINAFAPGPYPN